ncbi:MAG: tRNA pseudouridine(54/55) synthase Pus10 [Planctomycetes bacterium]|nr:tRNA pseudouridine(54/55) synthase Pus10 [Planctomycetota bacterium]
MAERAWRKMRLAEVAARPDVRAGLAEALSLGPLCDHCLGRLVAGADTGLTNEHRGRAVREALAAAPSPAPAGCSLCGGIFAAIDAWAARAREALAGWEFGTIAVASHPDPLPAAREQALWLRLGAGQAGSTSPWAAGDLAEPYKQEFNRLLGCRVCELAGCEADLKDPDITALADHAAGRVTLRVEPIFASGRYRKLVRGLPQCRWPQWPTSVQQLVVEPILRAAGGEEHFFHGCGREDVDVRCLGERPFVAEVVRPRRRRLDWAALAAEINRDGRIEVLGLAPCRRAEVARLKTLRPEKSYRALVRLAEEADEARLARLAGLAGPVRQRTPARVLRRRPDLDRIRRVVAITWRRVDGRTLELAVRTQAGLYVKELVSGDSGRTRPSVAEALGVAAECTELDVTAVHVD